ncbi:MAG: BMP family ABC transporter substrate-binding protein [Candidatus Lokiarchaeota archaeon]|nr:BMP family ABC transporter substrate-binding protein [Candidatus Lokiarchaeota archaeon]
MSSKSTLVTSLVIVVIVFAGVGATLFIANPYEPSRVAIVTMEPGLNDLSMANQVQEGLENLSFDVSVTYEPFNTTLDDAEDTLDNLASSGRFLLILVVGNFFESALETVAERHPNQYFAIINGQVSGDNIVSADFLMNEGAYLGGIIAAFLASERAGNESVGVLAAVNDNEKITQLVNGFIEGVIEANETYNLNITLIPTRYIDSFYDDDTAEDMIYDFFIEDNATVVFTPVRSSMRGIRAGLEAVNQTWYLDPNVNHLQRRPIIVAAEYDLNYYGTANPDIPVDPSWVATSVVARTDRATYNILYETLWNRFSGIQSNVTGLQGGWVNITGFEYSSTYISNYTIAAVKYYNEYYLANETWPAYL